MDKKFKVLAVVGLIMLLLVGGFVYRLATPTGTMTHSDRLVLLKPAQAIVTSPLWLTNEATLSDATLQGKWTFIYFGFTHCPDVCPAVLSALSRVYSHLGKEGQADQMQVYFITVDPKNDDKSVMIRYLQSFHPKFIGVTGTPSRLEFFKKQFGVFSENSDPVHINHSEVIIILNPQGRWVAMLTAPHFVDDLIKDIRYLMQQPEENK